MAQLTLSVDTSFIMGKINVFTNCSANVNKDPNSIQ